MIGEIKKLPITFRKHGYDYELVDREEKKAIYVQSYEGRVLAFEIIKITVRPERYIDLYGKFVGAHEEYPGSESWGTKAWTICDKEKAMQKYHSL